MSRLFLSVFVGFLVFPHMCVGEGKHRCENNATLKPCARLCEQTCTRPNKVHCNRMDGENCPIECGCNDGYVRDNGNCIRLEDCPRRCPTNETFTTCGRRCEPTCYNNRPRCSKILCNKRTQGCRCNKGYLRDPATNKCVHRKDCVKCGINEEVGACGRLCEQTCKDQRTDKCAAMFCTDLGCRCKPGFFRNEKTNMCGPIEQCPKPNECAYGEIKAPCGRRCEGTCKSPTLPKVCLYIKCAKQECRCNLDAGFVRDEKTGKCVRKRDCRRCRH